MIRPFKDGMLAQACPMSDIFSELTSQLDQLKVLQQMQNDSADVSPASNRSGMQSGV
jgi:adenylate cyclase